MACSAKGKNNPDEEKRDQQGNRRACWWLESRIGLPFSLRTGSDPDVTRPGYVSSDNTPIFICHPCSSLFHFRHVSVQRAHAYQDLFYSGKRWVTLIDLKANPRRRYSIVALGTDSHKGWPAQRCQGNLER